MNGFTNVQKWILKHWKNRSRGDFIILLLLGVLLLVISIPTGEKGQKNAEPQEERAYDAPAVSAGEESAYEKELEEKLEDLLESMEGVGRCRVMITFADGGTDCVDKDVSSGENRQEAKSVVYRGGEGEAPYVLKRQTPKAAGVVVVAEGGADAVVAAKISAAVMSLFQLEAHKITVVKMSVQEE